MRLRLPIDRQTLFLLGAVAIAVVFPARGQVADIFQWVVYGAIALLFFLYGARLSPKAVWQGLLHWRLQGLVFLFTFAVFPLLGLLAVLVLNPVMSDPLVAGILFLTLLPSTVQSSIAFTSIAGGNVPAALTSASLSNLVGVLVTPLLVMALMHSSGLGFGLDQIQKIALQILAPFAAGQAMRPLIGALLTRHRPLTAFVDRLSILLVVYAAFSEGMNAGVWSSIGWSDLALTVLASCVILLIVLVATTWTSRKLGFSRADEIAIVFCGSKKSMATGIPMAGILMPGPTLAMMVLPLMLFHQIQLFACAWMAQRYAERASTDASDAVGAPAVPARR